MRFFIAVAILDAVINCCVAPRAFANFFTVPFKAAVYMQALGGDAGAITEFGLHRIRGNVFTPIFTGLPYAPEPSGEVALGIFEAGAALDFYQRSEFGGTYWAYSSASDPASLVAFTDTTNMLGQGGSVVVPFGPDTWVLFLDDAPSYLFDDDNNDLFIQVRLAAVPEPGLLTLAISGCLAWAMTGRRKAIR